MPEYLIKGEMTTTLVGIRGDTARWKRAAKGLRGKSLETVELPWRRQSVGTLRSENGGITGTIGQLLNGKAGVVTIGTKAKREFSNAKNF